MKKKRKIAPSILAADFARLCEQIKLVEKGGAQIIHIDVMDGHFVPNISIGPPVVSSIRKCTDLFLDVHLMIENPLNYIDAFVKAGANNITFHVEAANDVIAVIDKIKSHHINAGISVKPATPVSAVSDYLERLDMFLIMSVEPGFGGQQFMLQALGKLREAQTLVQSKNLAVDIEVDGGVNTENIKMISDAGAEVIVAGSEIFGASDPLRRFKELNKIVQG
jgi:ribulose-phosphate 3-epimerase